MKLKKIASLMLAGIMAVSMLAACGEGIENGDDENNVPVVPVSDVATYANDALSNSQAKILNYATSDWLNDKLEEIVTNPSKFNSSTISNVYKDTSAVVKQETTIKGELNNSLDGVKAGSDNGFVNFPADQVSQRWSWVYLASGKIDEKSAVSAAAANIGQFVESASCAKTLTYQGTNYDCDYTAEISALKVSNDRLDNESAWVIAIVLKQTVTKDANTLV